MLESASRGGEGGSARSRGGSARSGGGLPGPGGGVCLVRVGGWWCLIRGGVVSQHALGQNPPCEQNDKQVYKYYLGHNFVAAGNKRHFIVSQCQWHEEK